MVWRIWVALAWVTMGCAARPPAKAEAARIAVPAGDAESSADSAGSSGALATLRQRPAWLFASDDCPIDVFPGVLVELAYDLPGCARDFEACLEGCREGDANVCFAAGIHAQELDAHVGAEALFLRGCRLGLALSCTNRAAGMQYHEPERAGAFECTSRTFAAMCRLDDAWGCTMIGENLLLGRGVGADAELSRALLERACALAPDEPPCEKATRLLDDEAAAGP